MSFRQFFTKFVVATGLGLAMLAGWSGPVSAHAGDGISSTNLRTEVNGFEPSLSDVRARLIEAGSRTELRVAGSRELTVLGFAGEPYLRVGPEGVFENQASPSVLLNSSNSELISVDLSERPVDWMKTSDKPVLRWYDKRINFSENNKPQPMLANAERGTWTVPLTVGSERVNLTGSVANIPGPNPMPKYLFAAVVAVAVAGLLLTRLWRRPLAVALAMLVVVDIQHAVAIAGRKEGLGVVLGELLSEIYVAVGWGMAAVAIAYIFKSRSEEREDALFYALFAALVMGFVGGFADIADLGRSQLPVAGSQELTRWCVAASIGLGSGIAIGCAIRLGLANRRKGYAESSKPMPANV